MKSKKILILCSMLAMGQLFAFNAQALPVLDNDENFATAVLIDVAKETIRSDLKLVAGDTCASCHAMNEKTVFYDLRDHHDANCHCGLFGHSMDGKFNSANDQAFVDNSKRSQWRHYFNPAAVNALHNQTLAVLGSFRRVWV